MKLKEYQGKEIFHDNGIKIPDSFLITSPEQIKELKGEVVLKAQVLHGGRGKAGLIQTATQEDAKQKAEEMFKKDVKEILVEEKVDVKEEYYLSITIDRTEKKAMLMFSKEGGIDIEELAEKHPKKIKKYYLDEEFSPKKTAKELEIPQWLIEKLYEIFKKYDLELIEINPLVKVDDNLLALDSKIIVDDNALFRQKFEKDESLTDIEKKAKEAGLSYVELEGNIGIIGNGAGLVMSTLDMVNHYGGKVANFLDVGGGADKEKMEKSLELVMIKKPKGIFINIFGGITRCDDIAQGLIDYKKEHNIEIPVVIRMIGTNEEEAKKILEENQIHFINSMEEGAKKIVELVK
ncbi:MAG: ADP-forming succinate--CoA ligase subunit beta [Nanoarchaeota archaeon]|nr:ADP-forming succinate--CoA ligase subunit beta [Nanoarchaeota archaeon]MCG2718107.1 ADP-forming succinate--CoA ligase subunit beta [Nanoarchaeota archaeon]